MIIEDLQRTAKEIRAEGHLGWGNVCDDAAARIAELTGLLREISENFDAVNCLDRKLFERLNNVL